MSIKNIIFDFGQVIVHFEPRIMVEKYADGEDAKILEEIVFDRLYWDKLDLGTITDEEVLSQICERLPSSLWQKARDIYYNWIYNIPVIDGMSELLDYLKERHGVRLFLISNISKYFSSHKNEIHVLSKFEDCVFSGEIGIVKPAKEIFDLLLEKHSLKAEETMFVDDNINNTTAAESYGIKAYLFKKDSDSLKVYLDSIL